MDAQIILGFEGRAYHVRDFYASQVLSMILGGGMSSRLFQEVREKRGLCYSVYAFHWGFSDTGIFGVHAATGQSDIAELVPVIVGELQKAGENISQDELNRARAQYRAGLVMSAESAASRASQIARQLLLVRPADPQGRAGRAAFGADRRAADRSVARGCFPPSRPSPRSGRSARSRPTRRSATRLPAAERRRPQARGLTTATDAMFSLPFFRRASPALKGERVDAAGCRSRATTANGRHSGRRAAASSSRGSRAGRPTSSTAARWRQRLRRYLEDYRSGHGGAPSSSSRTRPAR